MPDVPSDPPQQRRVLVLLNSILFERPSTDTALCAVDGRIVAIGPDRDVLIAALAAIGAPADSSNNGKEAADLEATLRQVSAEHIRSSSVGSLQILGGADVQDATRQLLVCPGFVDAHVHLLDAGRRQQRLSLRTARSKEEFRRIVREMVALASGPDEWIFGGDWNEELWSCGEDDPEQQLPTRDWIDDLTPHNPCVLHRTDCHTALVNRRAFECAGIDLDKGEAVEGGRFERYPETTSSTPKGEHGLNGVAREWAISRVMHAMPPSDTEASMRAALRSAERELLAHGITAVHTMTSLDFRSNADEIAFLRAEAAAGRLAIRVACTVRHRELPWVIRDAAAETPKLSAKVRDWVSIAGVKIFLDGSLGSRTAWFHHPYADVGGTGVPTLTCTDIDDAMRQTRRAGLTLSAHAIGDRAVSTLLDAAEAEMKSTVNTEEGLPPLRLRIEHCQHVRDQDLPRMRALRDSFGAEIIASMQPTHADCDTRTVVPAVGPQRALQAYRFRSLQRDGGVTLAFGSDWMVMPPRPGDSIRAASCVPLPYNTNEAISEVEAVHAFTSGPAKAVRWDGSLGRLAIGAYCDLTVLCRTVEHGSAPDEAATVAKRWGDVAFTIVDGVVRFDRSTQAG